MANETEQKSLRGETFGYEEGETCNRGLLRCKGVIEIRPVENCSCHIAPPCSACTSPRCYCPECDWEEKHDTIFNGFVVNADPATGVYKCYERRKLDNTKIDYHIMSHSNSSQKCEGVYPEGTTKEQVLNEVRGTFGGRFEQFGGGTFTYIAYTD